MRRLLAALLALGGLLLAAPAGAATPPDRDPVGANNWACRPTAAHPTPVVLVHGTFGDRSSLLDRLSGTLVRAGYCVYSLDYGNRATGPIEGSARELSAFVDKVLAATHARKASMVGHSQGGMMPRYYVKFLGGAGKVDDLIGLAPSNHGTTALDAFDSGGFGTYCYSCVQQQAGSDFLAGLNAGDESPGLVSYTQIVTRHDEVVVPYVSGYLARDARVTNVTIQDHCPLDATEHVNIPQDGPAIRMVLNALGRPGPLDPGFRPSCLP